ncbi:MAG TPA: bifunctional folylpolyglutamate synthase/dihydrofolate synthase, partial [Burkholderiaceae bacterium]|nr:bifunctional folylpolyglutamate synthase/dihydrofolate synthase [Burkholderiaceae bacterium]
MTTAPSVPSAANAAQHRLDDWLAHCERLHPKEIDMTLARVNALRDRLGLRFQAPVVMVAGT